MPVLESSFSPSALVRAASIQTIMPSLARRLPDPGFRREILELPDGDFLELDWLTRDSSRLAILSHGLEGSTASSYLRGMAQALSAAGYDVLAWNMRGCGTDRNRLKTWYHSGQSSDLRHVIEKALSCHKGSIALVGFSVGGNITLKLLGEEGAGISSQIRAAVVISVPMDLAGSAEQLADPRNAIYMAYLLKPLRARILEKAASFPGEFDTSGLDAIRTFRDFDSRFTAPMHGFASVDEYWERSSSCHYISANTVPTLAVSAADDPFLSPGCFPSEFAQASKLFSLEVPKHGGHVGFFTGFSLKLSWAEQRAISFLEPHFAQPTQGSFRVWA